MPYNLLFNEQKGLKYISRFAFTPRKIPKISADCDRTNSGYVYARQNIASNNLNSLFTQESPEKF